MNTQPETPASFDELHERWRAAFGKLTHQDISPERDLVVSPYGGHYGLAGYVVAVQGSPTHGTMIYDLSHGIITLLAPTLSRPVYLMLDDYSSEWKFGGTNPTKKSLLRATQAIIQKLGLPLRTGGNARAFWYIRHSQSLQPGLDDMEPVKLPPYIVSPKKDAP